MTAPRIPSNLSNRFEQAARKYFKEDKSKRLLVSVP